jgi:hypothetical protein
VKTILVCCLLAALPLQEELQRLKISVPDSDPLEVGLPRTWDAKIVQPRPQFPPTLKAAAPGRTPLSLQMTFLPLKAGKLSTSDEIKDVARKGNAHYVEGSVEKKIELVALESKTGEGYYCTLTDSSLADVNPIPEGKYLKVSSGIFVINRTLITFTILFNPPAAEQAKTALEAVARTAKP